MNHNFDDVTSIRTESYKLSGRDHNLLENHFSSNYQSRESLPVVSLTNPSHFDQPIESVDA